MTYPPKQYAGPLHHRNILFLITYAVLAAGIGSGLRVVTGQDLGSFYLITIAPYVLFLGNTLPRPFSEFPYWLKRLAWWLLGTSLALTTWVAALMTLKALPVFVYVPIGVTLAEIVLLATLQFGFERNPAVSWRIILLLAVVYGSINTGLMLFADDQLGFVHH